ncbi:MAG: arginine--tRNA ligase [Patescibacteria group bacterium]|nr:arginine--tRNA ligase [Patescibacteria group bacterium]MDE1945805.1 arginine--tRNA ligase [Patescibacteria group bacterium]
MEDTLKAAIKRALENLGIAAPADIVLEHPADLAHGDYSTNVAMVLAKQLKQNPRELAQKIADEINTNKPKEVTAVEVAGAGFINFRLAPEFFAAMTKEILKQKEKFGRGTGLKGKKILLEKSAPNLFKPFHVGHLLNLSIGESLSRILAASGAKVVPVAYPSDISLGASKAVWAVMQKKLANAMTVDNLGDAYVYGTKMYDEDEAVKRNIDEINKEIYEKKSGSALAVYEKGRDICLAYFKRITKRLGSKFDGYFFESEAGRLGKKIVEKHLGGIFENGENGAIIFPGEKYGLHTRVFITSAGLPVYEAKDIGLIELKFKKYHPDRSLVITDVEQKQYFEVIKKAATLVFGEWGERSSYWQHGRMHFAGGSISSRYGNVPLAEDLIDMVKGKVSEKMSSVEKKSRVAADDRLVEDIALAGLRYSFLRTGVGKNIIFDFDKSLSFEGDSGPYLQYSYARSRSVLRKAKDEGIKADVKRKIGEPGALEKLLYRFPEIVRRAGEEFAPHHIATYLVELASAWNSFYANNTIADKADAGAPYKVALASAFATVMRNGLDLLAIAAPERM